MPNDFKDDAFHSFINGLSDIDGLRPEVSCPIIHPKINEVIRQAEETGRIDVADWESQISACATESLLAIYRNDLTKVDDADEEVSTNAWPIDWGAGSTEAISTAAGPQEYLIDEEELRTMLQGAILMAFACRRNIAGDYE